MTPLTVWIQELKQQQDLESALSFFVKTSKAPLLYFEYSSAQAWLTLKYSSYSSNTVSVCLRLYETDPHFHPATLYNPMQVPVVHTEITKQLNTPDYQYYPLVFNNQIIGLFTYCSDCSLIKDQLFILDHYIKNNLWNQKWDSDKKIDEITGCLNKKNLLQGLFIEISRARRLCLPVSLIIMKLDQFSDLESSYGIYQSQLLLKALCKNIQKDTRTYDMVGSWLGAYVGIILPHTSERAASMKAEKMRWIVQSSDFSKVFPSHNRLSVSLGLAEYPRVARSADTLFRATLKALSFAYQDCEGNITAVATPAVGFKPDFHVQETAVNTMRELT